MTGLGSKSDCTAGMLMVLLPMAAGLKCGTGGIGTVLRMGYGSRRLDDDTTGYTPLHEGWWGVIRSI